MISKNDILSFVKHVHRRERGIPDRRSMHPKREWLIGLSISVLIVGAGAAYSLRTFEVYNNLDQRTYTVDIQLPNYNQTLTKIVIADYSQKQSKYEQLSSRAKVFVPVIKEEVATSTDQEATSTLPLATSSEAVVE